MVGAMKWKEKGGWRWFGECGSLLKAYFRQMLGLPRGLKGSIALLTFL